MMSAIKAEFKKILTVRSTYIVSVVLLLFLAGLIGFYGRGYRSVPGDRNSLFLAGTITAFSSITAIVLSVLSLLLLAHEYRYNTIVYTLTSANSRSKVLAAKIIAVFVFVGVAATVIIGSALAMSALGAAAAGHSLPHQDINVLTYMAKAVFFCEGFAMFGLLLAALVRNLMGAVAILLVAPNTLEGLLSIILKKDSVYMPFMALSQVIQQPVLSGAHAVNAESSADGTLSAPKGALVFLAYIVGGWLITWYLFLRRDAN